MINHHRDATIGHLFDLLLAPASHSESEVADLLRMGVEPLRDRMKDLRRRGLLAGPFRDSAGTKWKLRYATAIQARAAAMKSGLDPDAAVAVGTSFWIELRRHSRKAVTVASNSVRRWMQR
jgi:hypothetical protein